MRLLSAILLVVISFHANAQNALHLDSTDYVQTTYAGVAGNTARTVEAWIKTTVNADPNNSGVQQVIADYGTFATGQRYTFCLLWNNALRVEVSGSGLSGKIPVNDGQWHHVACIYDPSGTYKHALYVDGVLDTTNNIATSVNTGSSIDLRIGRRVDNARHFEGAIDELRVWDVARSAGDLQANMNNEICGSPANLKAYYKFDHGLAGGTNTGITTLVDATSGGNDGTLNGFALTGSTSNWVTGVNLTSGGPSSSSFNAVGCHGSYTSPSGKTWTVANTYNDTIPNFAGCDSVMTITLSFASVNTGISQAGGTLNAVASGATYQWLDCDDNYAIISGETNQSFSPTVNGNYAAQVTENGCTDTTNCIAVTGVGIAEQVVVVCNIFPNPSAGEILVSGVIAGDELSVVNSLGDVIHRFNPVGPADRINLRGLKSGVYWLRSAKSGISRKFILLPN